MGLGQGTGSERESVVHCGGVFCWRLSKANFKAGIICTWMAWCWMPETLMVLPNGQPLGCNGREPAGLLLHPWKTADLSVLPDKQAGRGFKSRQQSPNGRQSARLKRFVGVIRQILLGNLIHEVLKQKSRWQKRCDSHDLDTFWMLLSMHSLAIVVKRLSKIWLVS